MLGWGLRYSLKLTLRDRTDTASHRIAPRGLAPHLAQARTNIALRRPDGTAAGGGPASIALAEAGAHLGGVADEPCLRDGTGAEPCAGGIHRLFSFTPCPGFIPERLWGGGVVL